MTQPDLSRLQKLNEALQRGPAAADEALTSVAERAAVEANAFFATRRVPVRVSVRQGVRGATLIIAATRKITKPFTGRSPEDVVREILARHIADSGEQVAVEVARSLR